VRAFILKRLFEEEPKMGTNLKAGISFLSFTKIMDQFDPEMTDLDRATYFRNSWTAGNGVVNFDSFYLVANESNFFIKALKFMGFNSMPHLNYYEDFDLEESTQVNLEHVYKLWKANESFFSDTKKLLEVCGNELIINQFTRMESLIK
jgi:hypothetical protein